MQVSGRAAAWYCAGCRLGAALFGCEDSCVNKGKPRLSVEYGAGRVAPARQPEGGVQSLVELADRRGEARISQPASFSWRLGRRISRDDIGSIEPFSIVAGGQIAS